MSTSTAATPADLTTGLRSHTCGELRLSDAGKTVTVSGWVQTARDMNHFVFVDIRDRYGITQAVFNNSEEKSAAGDGLRERYAVAQKLGREFVVNVVGTVRERSNKNKNRPTGEIEIIAEKLTVLNTSKTPPFLIEDKTDANEDVRMKYRYLDIRRNPMKEALMLRHKVAQMVRNSLSNKEFIEVETPVLIKSTPEGARDFVVPSRMNPGQFYALPQSPQTFKQLLMVSGLDRYFQIVKCFRDEELRADRQPEFTQIDCEMAFVKQEDVLSTFEAMICDVFKSVIGHEFPPFQRMPYSQAMEEYGIDKPDIRYEMKLANLTSLAKKGEKGLPMFESAEIIIGIPVPGMAKYSNKKVKEIAKIATSQLCGAKAMVDIRCECLTEGKLKIKSSAAKFFSNEELAAMARAAKAKDGDMVCIFAGVEGPAHKTREAMGKFRHEMGTRLGLRSEGYKALWVVDFPLLEYDDEAKRWHAMHHPFTSPKEEDFKYMESDPGRVRANAYDMCINGVEVGGGSIRIHDKDLQHRVFSLLGFTKEAAEEQFGFLLGAFEFGAPPHGGLAFGLDRLCTILGGGNTIRDYIAFPKNNMGRDVMINSPSLISPEQMTELYVATVGVKEKNKEKNTADEEKKE